MGGGIVHQNLDKNSRGGGGGGGECDIWVRVCSSDRTSDEEGVKVEDERRCNGHIQNNSFQFLSFLNTGTYS